MLLYILQSAILGQRASAAIDMSLHLRICFLLFILIPRKSLTEMFIKRFPTSLHLLLDKSLGTRSKQWEKESLYTFFPNCRNLHKHGFVTDIPFVYLQVRHWIWGMIFEAYLRSHLLNSILVLLNLKHIYCYIASIV